MHTLTKEDLQHFPHQPAMPNRIMSKHERPNKHLANDVEAIQLAQQLHEGPLDLAISTCALAEALAANGIDLVHKDDAGLVLTRIAEHFTDQARRLTNVFVHNGGGDHLEEVGVNIAGNRTCKQCFACSSRKLSGEDGTDDRRHGLDTYTK